MSDLIRYPVGNTPVRDSINWPTILRSQIAGVFGALTTDEINAIWPVDMTLAQIMALAWRVRKWKLSGTAEATINYFDPGIDLTIVATAEAEISDTDTFILKDDAAATRERDLVFRVFSPTYRALVNDGIGAPAGAKPVSDWTLDGTETIGAGAPSPFSESGSTPAAGIGQLDPRIFGFVLWDPDTRKFSPPFTEFGDLIPGSPTPGGSARFILNMTFAKNPATVLSGTGPLLLKAPGTLNIVPGIAASFEVPMQLEWRLIGEAVGSSVSGTASAEFTLEAVEFFPYANSQNLPVYNTANGAELRSPFS